MKIIYMGTPDFAVPCLETLIKSKHEVVAVYTKEDKPQGRKQTLTPSAVKVLANKYNIPVYQPKTLKTDEEYEQIKTINADVIVVSAYGLILPKKILDEPKYGCINLHGSLLPKYRGAAPIQWSILNGEEKTGVTLMQINEGIDTGDMLLKKEVVIEENYTASILSDKLAKMSADIILDGLDKIEKGEITPQKQDDNLSNYAPMLDKSLCQIDWTKSAQEVHNKVRGLNSWPIAVSKINGKRIKIFSTEKADLKGNSGEILSVNPLIVGCGEGSVKILELQLDGKKRMNAQDFTRGYKLEIKNKFE